MFKPLCVMFGWQIRLHASVTFHTIQLVKGTPFQEKAPRIGHYRAYPLGGGGGAVSPTFCSDFEKCLLKNSNASDLRTITSILF